MQHIYKDKYLKYKTKYLSLKNKYINKLDLKGGANCSNRGYGQHLGECWHDSIMTNVSYADGIGDILQIIFDNPDFNINQFKSKRLNDKLKPINIEDEDIQDFALQYIANFYLRYINDKHITTPQETDILIEALKRNQKIINPCINLNEPFTLTTHEATLSPISKYLASNPPISSASPGSAAVSATAVSAAAVSPAVSAAAAAAAAAATAFIKKKKDEEKEREIGELRRARELFYPEPPSTIKDDIIATIREAIDATTAEIASRSEPKKESSFRTRERRFSTSMSLKCVESIYDISGINHINNIKYSHKSHSGTNEIISNNISILNYYLLPSNFIINNETIDLDFNDSLHYIITKLLKMVSCLNKVESVLIKSINETSGHMQSFITCDSNEYFYDDNKVDDTNYFKAFNWKLYIKDKVFKILCFIYNYGFKKYKVTDTPKFSIETDHSLFFNKINLIEDGEQIIDGINILKDYYKKTEFGHLLDIDDMYSYIFKMSIEDSTNIINILNKILEEKKIEFSDLYYVFSDFYTDHENFIDIYIYKLIGTVYTSKIGTIGRIKLNASLYYIDSFIFLYITKGTDTNIKKFRELNLDNYYHYNNPRTVELFKLFIEKYINTKIYYLFYMLSEAFNYNNNTIANLIIDEFIKNGKDINIHNSSGETILHSIAWSLKLSYLRIKNASPDEEQIIKLYLLLSKVQILNVLIKNGINFDKKDSEGETFFDILINNFDILKIKKHRFDIKKYVIEEIIKNMSSRKEIDVKKILRNSSDFERDKFNIIVRKFNLRRLY